MIISIFDGLQSLGKLVLTCVSQQLLGIRHPVTLLGRPNDFDVVLAREVCRVGCECVRAGEGRHRPGGGRVEIHVFGLNRQAGQEVRVEVALSGPVPCLERTNRLSRTERKEGKNFVDLFQ